MSPLSLRGTSWLLPRLLVLEGSRSLPVLLWLDRRRELLDRCWDWAFCSLSFLRE
jgi:hypothetical protein